jgi:hypothetical protein
MAKIITWLLMAVGVTILFCGVYFANRPPLYRANPVAATATPLTAANLRVLGPYTEGWWQLDKDGASSGHCNPDKGNIKVTLRGNYVYNDGIHQPSNNEKYNIVPSPHDWQKVGPNDYIEATGTGFQYLARKIDDNTMLHVMTTVVDPERVKKDWGSVERGLKTMSWWNGMYEYRCHYADN